MDIKKAADGEVYWGKKHTHTKYTVLLLLYKARGYDTLDIRFNPSPGPDNFSIFTKIECFT